MQVIHPGEHPKAVEALALLQTSFVRMCAEEREMCLHTVSLRPGESLLITDGWGLKSVTGRMYGRYARNRE